MIIEQAIWPVIELSDLITDMQPGFAQRPGQEDGGVPQLRTNNVSNSGTIDLSEVKYVRPSKGELRKYSVRRGDVIFNNTNSPDLVGKAAYFDLDEHFVLSNHMTRLRVVDELLDAEYLARYLHYLWKIEASLRWAKQWVNQAAIDQNGLARFLIPLPPLPEQRRIVAILRQADELRQLRRRANERTRNLLPALFYEVFGDPDHWENTKPITEYVDFVGGGTPSRKVERFYSGNIPWATSKDVKSRYLNDAQEHITEEAIESSATKLVPVGTILMVVKSKILAHSLPMGIATRPFCFGQDLKGLVCKPGVPPQFVYSVIDAQAGSLLQQARGVNTEGITLEMLGRLQVPKVDDDLVTAFSAQINFFDTIEEQQLTSERQTEALFQSLLARAFTGELTPVWRVAHAEELAVAAAERDRLLGAADHPRRKAAVDLNTDAGQEAFAATLDQIIMPSTQHLLNNLGSTAALVATLRESPFAQLSRQLQEAAQINANLVNAEIFRSVSNLAEATQTALAQAVTPMRQIQGSLAQVADTLDATQRVIQSTNLSWALQLAETAASILRRPDPDHPRFGLLRDLSENQYATYVAIKSTDRCATAENLAEEMGWSAQRVAQNLTLLAAVGLVQSAALPTQPTGDQVVYVQVYRALQPNDDVWSDDLRQLAELSA